MNHPYKEFEATALWKTIDASLAELERNRDINLSAPREHVVGYLCQQLASQKLAADNSILRESL